MKNCNDDLIAYHDKKATLPDAERREMRDRRDANRQRLKTGLDRERAPKTIECRSQGSYAMRTMVQQPDKDYDIDDGVYFDKDKLKGPRGGDKTSSDAKDMVRKALQDERFDTPPESRTNCVRVYYAAGYHVDIPVYRRVRETNSWGEAITWFELAGTEWKRSDPLAVTAWFAAENKRQSPDTANGGQLRRIVRLLKAFARSRPSWRDSIASGFMITKLVVDHYAPHSGRDDLALYHTMVAIYDRLCTTLEIEHPTVVGEMLTKGPDDARAKHLRDKLGWAVEQLQDTFLLDCTRAHTLGAWDKIFHTTFFSDRLSSDSPSLGAGATGLVTAPLIRPLSQVAPRRPVDKRGGGRYG